VFVLQLAF